jgi:hypothetical protein
MSAGVINGYAVIFDAVSADFSEKGQPARYKKIERGALKIAPNAIANINHFEPSSFAFASDLLA